MKFRNPKVFEDIEKARVAYCAPISHANCCKCPLNSNNNGTNRNMDCGEFVESYPAAAARLMGYEVVEESTMGQVNQMEQSTKPRIAWDKIGPETAVWCRTEEEAEKFVEAARGRYPERCKIWEKGETCWPNYTDQTCYVLSFYGGKSMEYSRKDFYVEQGYTIVPFTELLEPAKPRICQVLGVEVGERFGDGLFEYEITPNEKMLWISNCGRGECSAGNLIKIINHPDRIIRKPRFTEEEVARAKNLLDVVGGGTISNPGTGGTFLIADRKSISLRDDVFPSLSSGQFIPLDHITGGNP